jgi:hypothetical protein
MRRWVFYLSVALLAFEILEKMESLMLLLKHNYIQRNL